MYHSGSFDLRKAKRNFILVCREIPKVIFKGAYLPVKTTFFSIRALHSDWRWPPLNTPRLSHDAPPFTNPRRGILNQET